MKSIRKKDFDVAGYIAERFRYIRMNKSEVHELILKHNQLDEFPPNLSAQLNSNCFYEEKILYLTKTENKYPERLKIGLDLSNPKQLLTYKYRQGTF